MAYDNKEYPDKMTLDRPRPFSNEDLSQEETFVCVYYECNLQTSIMY